MPVKQRRGDKKQNGSKQAPAPKPAPKTAAARPASVGAQSSRFPWGGLVVAFFSLALGLLTPPLLIPTNTPEPSLVDNERQLRDELVHGVQDPCREEELARVLHDTLVPGLHVICLRATGVDDSDDRSPQLQVVFYKNGLKSNENQVELPVFIDWPQLQESFVEHLGLKPANGNKQPWAIFSTTGKRLVSEDSQEQVKGEYPVTLTKDHGLVLLYEGGQFIWPGVHIGFERTVDLYSIMPETSPEMGDKNQTVTLETLSLSPLVFSVKGFLTESECHHIQEIAAPSMQYSGVVLMDKDAGRPASDFRTSQTTFLAPKDEIMVDIEYRTASLVRIPRSHQENTQVLRYGIGEKYNSHHDCFDPGLYQNDANTLQLIQHGRRNRLATVFWYLSNVQAGGETVFPRFNGGLEKSPTDCETGLKVKPEAGKVIIFYSMKANGQRDEASLHGACPVKEGVKWAANKWVWNEQMPYTPP